MNKQIQLINNCINQANNIINDINGQMFYVSRQKANDTVTPIIISSPKKAKNISKKLYAATLNISDYKDALEHTKSQLIAHSKVYTK